MSDEQTTEATAHTLVLVRHGERADGRHVRHPWQKNRGPRPEDCPLTGCGRRQAAAVGRSLVSESVRCSVIYTSPMRRCLETASEIAKQMDLPVVVVVPLAKSCSYFRSCAQLRKEPLVANASEAAKILESIQPTVSLQAYYEDDGLDCTATIERLVKESNAASNEEKTITLIVGHCESQRALATICGFRGRIGTPYCGKVTFQLQVNLNSNASWHLLGTPRARDMRRFESWRHRLLTTSLQ